MKAENEIVFPSHKFLKGEFTYIILILLLCGFYSLLYWNFVIDDAYITFAYSKNLRDGTGLVLRQGTNVEATSSFLWALLLGVASIIGYSPPIWAKMFGFIFSLLSAIGIYGIFSFAAKRKLEKAMLAVAAALPFSFGLWSNYGMENGLLAFLCVAGIICIPDARSIQAYAIAALVLMMLHMTRPEGFGYVIIIVCAEATRRYLINSLDRSFLAVPLILVFLILSYEVFGLFYYDTLLPDSALAKISTPVLARIWAGVRYSIKNIWAVWPVFLCIYLAVTDFVAGKFSRDIVRAHGSIFLGLALALASVAYVLVAGGDWMIGGRFYAFIVPFCSAYVVWSVLGRNLLISDGAKAWILGLFAASQLGAALFAHPGLIKLHNAEEKALQQMVLDLNQFATPNQTLALSDIGRASYGFRGQVFDWWGLASRLVREHKEQIGGITSKTFSKISPEFLVVYSNSEDGPKLDEPPLQMTLTSFGLIKDKTLMANYCRLKPYFFWQDRWHQLLARKDVWLKLRESQLPEGMQTRSCVNPVFENR